MSVSRYIQTLFYKYDKTTLFNILKTFRKSSVTFHVDELEVTKIIFHEFRRGNFPVKNPSTSTWLKMYYIKLSINQ